MRGFSRTWPTKGPRWANPTAPSRRSVNERRPSRRVRRPQRDDRQLEQDDHRAGGFADNLVDQFECVVGALAEPNKRNIGALSRGRRADILDLDLAGDHLMTEAHDDRSNKRQTVFALIGDQDA